MRLALLLFLSSLLLFLVQPILGKALLPEWGGSASVWTACLLFFQVGLLLGYLYAYCIARWLTVRAQIATHLGLLLLTLLWLPLRGTTSQAMLDSMLSLQLAPSLQILVALALTVGLPYVLLASTSPLLSHWYYLRVATDEPYRWYALASLGSLVGCLLYPFAVEPWVGLRVQETLWTALYGLLCVGLAFHLWRFYHWSQNHPAHPTHLSASPKRTEPEAVLAVEPRKTLFPTLMWIGLSACSSIVLSASTSNASQAGIVVPGLWVLPLSMYLVSWWFAFRSPALERWSSHMLLFFSGGILALFLLIFKLWVPWTVIVVGYVAVVGLVSLACHNLLFTVRPAAERLTSFYLAIALGGALGSAFVSLIAPNLFHDYWELHIGLGMGAALIALHYLWRLSPQLTTHPWVRRYYWPATLLAAVMLIGTLFMHANVKSLDTLVEQRRDFYGLVSVTEQPKSGLRTMLHGQTRHGAEPIDAQLHPDRTMYYQSNSGAALAWGWCHDRKRTPLRVGVVGLGTGSLSLYARQSDHMIYYEVSPAVQAMAEEHFHYLRAHTGTTEIRIGDGRRLLTQEAADANEPPLDLLLIDAFSNDSLPMHLLTVEALELYRRRLAANSLIAMNITNRNLDLAPVLFATAARCQLQPLLVESPLEDTAPTPRNTARTGPVRWLLLFPADVDLPAWPYARRELRPSEQSMVDTPWTDDFASPLHALRWLR
jgi:hypothetical protein